MLEPDKLQACVAAGSAGVHFSQWGEDVVLWHFLRLQRDGFYVDIGAHHPERMSNTALLHYSNGWSGINVEPDERLYQAFVEMRPHDINLCCGVGATNGSATISIFEDGAVNSFDATSVDIQITRAGKKLIGHREVPIRTLQSVLEEHLPTGRQVDLLNVDVEGWDTVALASNDWSRYAPRFVVVEDHKMNLAVAERSPTFQLLARHGYRLVAQTLATSIYLRGQ